MEMSGRRGRTTLRVSGRGLEHEIRAVDRQGRVVARQPEWPSDIERERVRESDRDNEADELMEAVFPPTSDG
jgi:hypothetical protein